MGILIGYSFFPTINGDLILKKIVDSQEYMKKWHINNGTYSGWEKNYTVFQCYKVILCGIKLVGVAACRSS